MALSFIAISENEGLARMVMTSFIASLDPTIDELAEFKTIVSEAVTNAIIHGYEEDGKGIVTIRAKRNDRQITMTISDEGRGIPDVEQAMEPLYTSKPENERSGMGFTIMESFSDHLSVWSEPQKGTAITFTKDFQPIQSKVVMGER